MLLVFTSVLTLKQAQHWVAIMANLLKRRVLRAALRPGLKFLDVVRGVVVKGCLREGVLLFLSMSARFPTLVRSQECKMEILH